MQQLARGRRRRRPSPAHARRSSPDMNPSLRFSSPFSARSGCRARADGVKTMSSHRILGTRRRAQGLRSGRQDPPFSTCCSPTPSTLRGLRPTVGQRRERACLPRSCHVRPTAGSRASSPPHLLRPLLPLPPRSRSGHEWAGGGEVGGGGE
jgi:hypothetical protein